MKVLQTFCNIQSNDHSLIPCEWLESFDFPIKKMPTWSLIRHIFIHQNFLSFFRAITNKRKYIPMTDGLFWSSCIIFIESFVHLSEFHLDYPPTSWLILINSSAMKVVYIHIRWCQMINQRNHGQSWHEHKDYPQQTHQTLFDVEYHSDWWHGRDVLFHICSTSHWWTADGFGQSLGSKPKSELIRGFQYKNQNRRFNKMLKKKKKNIFIEEKKQRALH